MTRRDFTLIFPHIPKTGGTTLFNHFSKALGDDRVFVVGRHNRTRRFFQNRPQFEGASPQDIARLKVIQGHGVGQSHLPWVDAEKTKLIVILRDPVARTKSAYNQQLRRHERQGGSYSTEAFLKKNWDNLMSQALIKSFPDFVSDRSAPLHCQARDVLRCFDYVFTTEGMDRQLPPVLEWLGLPTTIERRRVSETKRALDIDDAELARRNAHDMEIFKACSAPTVSGGETFNPLGFDPEARQAALARVLQTKDTAEQRLDIAYRQLATGLCFDLLAEAAFVRLDDDADNIALPDPAAFRAILEETWAAKSQRLSEAETALSTKKMQRHLKRQVARLGLSQPAGKAEQTSTS